jgi:hypothetical protein
LQYDPDIGGGETASFVAKVVPKTTQAKVTDTRKNLGKNIVSTTTKPILSNESKTLRKEQIPLDLRNFNKPHAEENKNRTEDDDNDDPLDANQKEVIFKIKLSESEYRMLIKERANKAFT